MYHTYAQVLLVRSVQCTNRIWEEGCLQHVTYMQLLSQGHVYTYLKTFVLQPLVKEKMKDFQSLLSAGVPILVAEGIESTLQYSQ